MHCPSDQGRSFHYRVFGLHVLSDLELPELWPVNPIDEPDVRVSLGDGSANEGTLLAIDGIAHFYVQGGSHIRVVPKTGAPGRNVRLYLLGSAMGMLLHQRGLLPLHANAVEIDGKAVAFMGSSGAGKSTLAVWFHDLGHRIIADDVCVVRFDDQGSPLAMPGMPRLRLWREILEMTGRDAAQLARSYAGADEWEKYDVPLSGDRVATSPTELAAIYLLERGESLHIAELSGAAAADALFANTYRGAEVPRSGKPRVHWEACLRLIEQVPLFLLRRPLAHELLDDQGEAIVAHVRKSLMTDRKLRRTF